MQICAKVKEILKTNNLSEFQNLVNFVKYTNCKSEIEVRAIFASCGMNPEKFDELKKLIFSQKDKK